MQRAHAKYGDMFTMRIAQEGTWVFLAHPDMVKEVFKGSPKRLHAGEANAILRPVLGSQSVLLLDEESHMSQRKLMLPPFHGDRMQRYGELMREVTAAEIAGWAPGEPLEVWPRMQAITLEIIMRAVFGLREGARLDGLRAALDQLLHFVVRPSSMLTLAFLGPGKIGELKSFRRAMKPVDDLLLAEIRERRAEADLEGRDDILSMLLQARHTHEGTGEDGEPMTDVELRDELMTLLVAGHETTATSLAWAVERLVRHPGKLRRLRDEIASGDEAYLDAVCKETLRLRPVLPVVVRTLTEPMEIGGHTLPTGVKVAPCIHLIHRREDIYRNAAAFEPERFLETPAGTYTWIPFGGGVRRCIGATFALFEMRQVLATIVQRLDLQAPAEQSERIARRAITLTPGSGARVIARPRAAQRSAVAA